MRGAPEVKLSLATKIFVGFLVLLGTFALLAFFSVREIRAVAEDLRTIKEGHLALARLAAQLETHQQNRFRDLRRALQELDRRNQEVVLRIAIAYFPDVIRSTVEDARAVCQSQIERIRSQGGDEADMKIEFYRGIAHRIDRIAEQHEQIDELTRQTSQRLKAEESVEDVLPRVEQLEVALRSDTYQLNKYINDETDRAVRRAEQDERNAVWRVIVMAAIALLVGLMLTFLSARALAPIGRLVRYARAISRGDYEQSVDTHGEGELASLAEELQQMARSRKDREAELDRQAAELEVAYRRVAELKRYHESVVRSLRTAVVVTDRELAITSTNRAAETHWGLAPEVRGRSLEALPIGPPMVKELGPLNALVQRVETVNVKAVPLGELCADVTIAPLQNERGDVLGLVVALEDVTEAIRTKEALIRSERLAAIGRMSAHVTHEIRNPLSSIGLNAELLADLNADEEAKSICRAITREVDRLTAITDEYLRFARLPRPELEEEDVASMLNTIAAFVRRDCEAANVKLDVQVPPDLPRVHVDADQMRQAILNLLRNAKESMPQGGSIVLGADQSNGEVAIYVKDTGFGIPAEAIDRIFDPFYSTKLTGTGLGLALTHQIVTEHGGQLRVASAVGVGSEFRILLENPRSAA
jgi:nitrogen fixation/metabolism regulation signal transduction histidine kinase